MRENILNRAAGPFRLSVRLAMAMGLASSFLLSLSAAAGGKETGAPIFWVYHDGKFAWPGDYSYAANIDYSDVKGVPASGVKDVKVSLTSPWGAWQPYATNWVFDTAPFTHLRFAIKPTRENQQASVFFMLVGDKPVGIHVDFRKYGPAPVVGKWTLYNLPLADIGVSNTKIYKFDIQDQTGAPDNVFYVDEVCFVNEAPAT